MLFVEKNFLFVFLPLALLGYWFLWSQRWRRPGVVWLVGMSWIFYGWWKPIFLALLLGSILFNFFVGRRIVAASSRGRAKAWMIFGVTLNLGSIAYYKYANFLLGNFNALAGTEFWIEGLVLPLGISFFTFQQIAYLADCYQTLRSENSLLHYGLFVSFFPQLIAGPIVHHEQILPQLATGEQLRVARENFLPALNLFIVALFKKLVIADSLAPVARQVFSQVDAGQAVTGAEAWLGLFAYTFQIYFDFSAYSEMALAMGLFFGLKLPVNFRSPYRATNIVDFWRRWHITLSTFLRDYLYIPLGGNRRGKWRRYQNLILTMLLGGLWHGASWNFVFWGALHGFYLIVNHAWHRFGFRLHAIFCWPLTFGAAMVAWAFFRAETWKGAWALLGAAVGREGWSVEGLWMPHFVRPDLSAWSRVGVELSAIGERPWVASLFSPAGQGWLWVLFAAVLSLGPLRALQWAERARGRTLAHALLLALLIVWLIVQSFNAPPGEFIYYQF